MDNDVTLLEIDGEVKAVTAEQLENWTAQGWVLRAMTRDTRVAYRDFSGQLPFSCGHRGFGENCHRCEQAAEAEKNGHPEWAERMRSTDRGPRKHWKWIDQQLELLK